MPYKNKTEQKKAQRRSYLLNKQEIIEKTKKRRAHTQESAILSLFYKRIIDNRCWQLWFNKKATNGYKPCYISPEIAFNLMIQNCFYCGGFSTTLDRLDSAKEHTLDNCVGCCDFCNQSKQAQDPKTFILQAVYRRRFIYYEDDDIWYDNTRKPRLRGYKEKALKQDKKFELSETEFNAYIVNRCHYCRRFPPTSKFFGIDKVFPDDGYVKSNCVTACAGCNFSKRDYTAEEFILRDERITERYLAGYFDTLPMIPKNISHHKNV